MNKRLPFTCVISQLFSHLLMTFFSIPPLLLRKKQDKNPFQSLNITYHAPHAEQHPDSLFSYLIC